MNYLGLTFKVSIALEIILRSFSGMYKNILIDPAVMLPADYVCLYNKISGAQFARAKRSDYFGGKMSTLPINLGDVTLLGLSLSNPLHPSTGSGRTAFSSPSSGRAAFLSTASLFSSFQKWSRKYVAKSPTYAFGCSYY